MTNIIVLLLALTLSIVCIAVSMTAFVFALKRRRTHPAIWWGFGACISAVPLITGIFIAQGVYFGMPHDSLTWVRITGYFTGFSLMSLVLWLLFCKVDWTMVRGDRKRSQEAHFP